MPDLPSVVVSLGLRFLLPLLRWLFAPSRSEKRHGLRVKRTEWSLGVFRQERVEIEFFDDRD